MNRMMTRGDRVIAFIERYCNIPEGPMVGQPVKLAPFQKKFIIDVYDNPHGTRMAILSIGRKNAKTALVAFLMAAYLVGPEAVQNSQIESGAMSKEQAAKVYVYLRKMVEVSPKLSGKIFFRPSQKEAVGLALNVTYTVRASDAKTAHGGSPMVVCLDELGQVRGPHSDFYDAMTTGQGAYENAIVFIISTQAASDADLLSILIDAQRANPDKHTICHVYEAKKGCDLMDEKEWKASNPGLGHFRSEQDLRIQAERAKRMPSRANAFRNLVLNQRVDARSPILTRDAWELCAAEPYPLEECEVIFGGLDLSARIDLTAFVLLGYHQPTETWNAHVIAWTPEEGLLDRAKRDRAPYDVWVEQGIMRTTPGSAVEYEFVAADIAAMTSQVAISAIGYDRWRVDLMKKEFERIGLSLELTPIGQGYRDMGPAVESLETLVVGKKLRHGSNPLLNMAVSNATATKDPSGARKPDKVKATGRIDPIVALIIAVAARDKGDMQSPAGFDDFISDPLVLG